MNRKIQNSVCLTALPYFLLGVLLLGTLGMSGCQPENKIEAPAAQKTAGESAESAAGKPAENAAENAAEKPAENAAEKKNVAETLFSGEPKGDPKPETKALTPEEEAFEKYENDPEAWKKIVEDDEYMAKPLEFGKLLVDDAKTLTRLDPERAIWVDKPNGLVVMQGWICQNQAPLEFLICFGKGFLRTFPYRNENGEPEKLLQFNGPKAHESVISVDVPASMIHAGLLAIGANTGTPVRFQPKFEPPTGDVIRVQVRWTKPDGTIANYLGQELVVDMEAKKPMTAPWIFAGGEFYADDSGTQHYSADANGEIIGVCNFPSVMIDIGQESTDANAELSFQACTEKLPERGTPVTVILSVEKKSDAPSK